MRYIGSDFQKDMDSIKENEATKKWWQVSFILLIFIWLYQLTFGQSQ